ncbi:MAG: PAS domain-containing protein [Desertimonas sp.]
MTTDTPTTATHGADGTPRSTGRREGTVDDTTLATFVRAMADAVLIADPDGRIVYWNDAATRLFGWPASEAIGASLDLIVPERLRERHWVGWQQVMRTGVTRYGEQLLEVPAAHQDGRRLSIAFTVSLLTDEADVVTAVAAVIRDDTERWEQRRSARQELTALRSQLDAQRSVDGAPDSVSTATPDGAGS